MNRKRYSLISSVLLITVLLFVSCGRKAPPSLKAYEKPQTPSALSVTYREDILTLSWSYPDNLRETIKGFLVLRSENGDFERIAFVKSESNSLTERGFKPGRAYKYKVVAQSQRDVLSNDSNVIAVTPMPLPSPPGKIAFSVKPDYVELSWDSSGEGVCYNVYKSAAKGVSDGAPINRDPVCATTYKDRAITPGKTAFYTLRALSMRGAPGEGYASAEVEVSPSSFIPSPPSDLRIAEGDDATFLSWKESPEQWVRGYRVYRKANGEPGFTFIGEVGTPAFVDRMKIDKKVRYVIRALGPVAESEPLEGE